MLTSHTCVDSLHAGLSAAGGTTSLVRQTLAIMHALGSLHRADRRRASTVAVLCQTQGKCVKAHSTVRNRVIYSHTHAASTRVTAYWEASLLANSNSASRRFGLGLGERHEGP